MVAATPPVLVKPNDILRNGFQNIWVSLPYKVLKGQQSTAAMDHMLDCDHVVKPDDFILMTRDNSDYFLQIKESLFIGRDDPSLNRTTKSVPLHLF